MAFSAVNRIAGPAVEGLFPPWLRRARTIEPFSLSVQGHSRNLHAQAISAFPPRTDIWLQHNICR